MCGVVVEKICVIVCRYNYLLQSRVSCLSSRVNAKKKCAPVCDKMRAWVCT